MGYTSDVALVLFEKDFVKLKSTQSIKKLFDNSDKQLKKDDCVMVIWYCYKWSDCDITVSDLLDSLDENVEYDDYFFLRIGEGLEDNEVTGGFWDNPFDCRIFRTIEWNGCTDDQDKLDSVQLKSKNTHPKATHCANCKAKLKDPMPGSPNLKYCPICEP